MAKPLPRAALDDYRHATASASASGVADRGFDLAGVDPAAKPCSTGDKAKDKARVEAIARAGTRLHSDASALIASGTHPSRSNVQDVY